jgi:hypothetical protein
VPAQAGDFNRLDRAAGEADQRLGGQGMKVIDISVDPAGAAAVHTREDDDVGFQNSSTSTRPW